HAVAIWAVRDDRIVPCAVATAPDADPVRFTDLSRRFGILGAALAGGVEVGRRGQGGSDTSLGGILLAGSHQDAALAVLADGRPELAVPIPGERETWGVLLIVGDAPGALGVRDLEAARVLADGLAGLITATARTAEIAHLRHRAEALRRVASDIGSRLDLERIL